MVYYIRRNKGKMEDIWQQFHRLPRAIRDSVASPAALSTIDRLEADHPGLDLAGFVMRVMVKEFLPSQLAQKIQDEAHLDRAVAEDVAKQMQESIFMPVGEYLGLTTSAPAASAEPPVTPAPANLPVAPEPAPTKLVSPTPAAPKVPLQVMSAVPASTPTGMPAAPKPSQVVPMNINPARPADVAPTQAYSDDDAQEIERQTARLKNIQSASLGGFDEMAQAVLQQHNLAFRDDILTKRASTILKARLKDIRSSAETLEMLTREPKVGGLGLDADLAKQVVVSLDELAKGTKAKGMAERPTPVAAPLPPKIPTITATKPEPLPPLRTVLPADGLRSMPEPVIPNVTEEPRRAPQIKRPADIPPPPPIAQAPAPAPKPKPAPSTVVQRSLAPDRPVMGDVRPPKAMGPSEELRTMTVAEFRRLGQGAGDSMRRVLEKLDHLKSESFTLWAEGVAGWRQSEVFQTYLEMGRQSLEQGMPISQVIEERGKRGQTYVSENEFSIIADLNRQLQM